MKKNIFISAALACVAFSSCQQENLGGNGAELDGFRVHTEDMTKAVLDGVKVVFEDEDAIDIYADAAETPSVYSYNKANDLFVATGTEAEGAEYTAIFPSRATNPSRSSIYISNRQVATVNSFPKSSMYMAGVSSSKEIALKHLTGLWEIDLLPQYDGQKLARASLAMNGGQKINGNFEINWEDYSLTYVDGGNNSILLAEIAYVMTAGEPVKLYFALPEGSYEGFTFQAVMTDNTTMEVVSPSTINIVKGQITKVKNNVNYRLFDSGTGTETDPYVIKGVTHWNNMVQKINSDATNYASAYYKVAADIDFKNAEVTPINEFRGTIDGDNHTLKNAKVGDGTASHQAFFPYLSGTIKNITFDNITVNASAPSASGDASTSAGVIVAGNNDKAFILENCHVTNSSVTSGKDGDTYGGYAGGLAGRAKSGSVIRNCSVKNTVVTCLTQNAGALVGNIGTVTIDSALSCGNTVNSSNNSGGIVGGAGPGAMIINCISEDNLCCVKSYSAGGIVGANAWNSNSTGEYPQIINVLSSGNTVKSARIDGSTLYLGLLVGCRGTNDNNMSIKNCLVSSGTALYDYTITTGNYPHTACVGIVIGYGSPSVESVYFNGAYRSLYDAYLYDVTEGKLRNAVGVKQSNVTSNSRGGTTLTGITECAETVLSDGTCLDALNLWVSSNKETYPTLKEWVAGDDGYPTLILSDAATTSLNSLNIIESNY